MMNLRKLVSSIGYPVLRPLSACMKVQTSSMALAEARRIVADVYDIDRQTIAGGGDPLKPNELDITFVVPVYNSEAFVERCVLSILQQKTTARYEVVCIDDGSTDHSLDILQRLQTQHDDKMRVLTQDNHGIAATRNRGIVEARGEYIGFIDNDDYVADTYVETLWQCRRQTDADMIQIGHTFVNASGAVIGTNTKPARLFSDNSQEMVEYVSGYIWSGLHRKQNFAQVRFPEGFWYEDMITKVLLSRVCQRYVFIDACLYNKTLHGLNASRTLWRADNPKCIDDLYLMMYLTKYGNEVLHLKADDRQMYLITNELNQLFRRTWRLNRRLREAIFIIGCDFVQSNAASATLKVTDPCLMRLYDDFINRHFLKYNIDGWLNWFDENRK